jgi:23S rRNA pseudouridine2605 synthase
MSNDDLNRREGGFSNASGNNGPGKRLRKRIIIKKNPDEGDAEKKREEDSRFEKIEYNRPYKKPFDRPQGDRNQNDRPPRTDRGDRPPRTGDDRPPRTDRPYNPNYRRNDSGGNSYGGGSGGGNYNRSSGGENRGGGGFKKPYSNNKFGKKPFAKPAFEKKKKTPKEKNKHSYTTHQFEYDENTETRLNKFLSNAGICSRREADKLIQQGIITINNEVVTELGCRVRPGDIVRYNGQVIGREEYVYLLLNKPKDYITTMNDPEGRKTVMDIMGQATKERIFPVGRLDRNTTGILLFTNDGDLAQVLTHPKYNVKKVYIAILDKNLADADMDSLMRGIELEDGTIAVDNIAYIQGDKSRVGVEIHSGRNRIIHRMFEHLGYTVDQLDRVYYAGMTKKDLPRGRYRFLNEEEVRELKKQAGKLKESLDA